MELTVFMLTIVILSTPPNTVKLLKQNNLLKKTAFGSIKIEPIAYSKADKKNIYKIRT